MAFVCHARNIDPRIHGCLIAGTCYPFRGKEYRQAQSTSMDRSNLWATWKERAVRRWQLIEAQPYVATARIGGPTSRRTHVGTTLPISRTQNYRADAFSERARDPQYSTFHDHGVIANPDIW